jgi:hypothetical protein
VADNRGSAAGEESLEAHGQQPALCCPEAAEGLPEGDGVAIASLQARRAMDAEALRGREAEEGLVGLDEAASGGHRIFADEPLRQVPAVPA